MSDLLILLTILVAPLLVHTCYLIASKRKAARREAERLASGWECPTCHEKPLRWTGQNLEGQSGEDEWVSAFDFECQPCGRRFTFTDEGVQRDDLGFFKHVEHSGPHELGQSTRRDTNP